MPSWQARTLSLFIRLVVKRRPPKNLDRYIEVVRKKLEPAPFLRPPLPKGVQIEPITEGEIDGEWLRWTENPQQTVYFLHGGGYVALRPETYRPFTTYLSRAAQAEVFALNYRRAPEDLFPAPVEDAVAGYRWLLRNGTKAENIVIGGDSAGGGLTMATLVALRDAGEPLPRAAFVLSPWTDLAVTGQSMITNDRKDPMFYAEGVRKLAPFYLGAASPTNPLASPIYADLTGLPPLLIYVSDTEVLLDDSIRLAERAKECGVDAELRIHENLPHVWPVFVHFGLPEAKAAISEIVEFIRRQPSQTAQKSAA